VHLRGRDFDQVIFKHAISNISVPKQVVQRMQGLMDREAPVENPVTGDAGEIGIMSDK